MSHIFVTFRKISWKSTVNSWQKFTKVHHLIQQGSNKSLNVLLEMHVASPQNELLLLYVKFYKVPKSLQQNVKKVPPLHTLNSVTVSGGVKYKRSSLAGKIGQNLGARNFRVAEFQCSTLRNPHSLTSFSKIFAAVHGLRGRGGQVFSVPVLRGASFQCFGISEFLRLPGTN